VTVGLEGIGLPPSSANVGRAYITLATATISGNFPIRTSSFANATNEVNKKAACLFVRCTDGNGYLMVAMPARAREILSGQATILESAGDRGPLGY
jgi:hypothetical protein